MTPLEAWELFTTPPARRVTAAEARILRGAERFVLDYPGERLEGGPCRLAAYAWGAGPTVFLVHGWGGRGAQLGFFVEPLVQRGFRVLAVDAPAHGDSDGTRTNIYEFAATLVEVVRRHGPVHAVVGHSLGGTAATLVASRGQYDGRLVVIGAMDRLCHEVSKFARRLELPDGVERGMRRHMEQLFHPGIWDETSLRSHTPEVDLPALLVHDEDDQEVDVREIEDAARAWPGAELYRTSGLGHFAPLRNAAVTERVAEFVAGGAPAG